MSLYNDASLILIPSGIKEDTIFSQKPTNGNGDLSFTRASNGTRINSAGLVEVCPWNLVEYSENFTSNWNPNSNTITANSTTAPNGTITADTFTLTASADSSVYQAVNGVSNNYTSFVYAKYVSGGQYLYFFSQLNSQGVKVWFNIQNGTVSNQVSGFTGTIENVGNGWFKCAVYNSTAVISDYIQFGISSTNSSRTLSTNSVSFFWGAQVNIGTIKPYFPTTDRLNVPRLTYQNGGGGCPSLLLEKQSTNLVLYSQDLTQSGQWLTLANAVVSGTKVTSPDGTQNSNQVIYDGTGNCRVEQVIGGVTSGADYTFSVYLRVASGTASVEIGHGSSTVAQTVTTTWQRFSVTQIPIVGTSYPRIMCNFAKTVEVWGAQLEQSSYVTSYIPTTSSSATRVEDAVPNSLTLLANKLNYSVFLDFYPRPTELFQYFFIQLNNSVSAEIIWGGTSGGTDFTIFDYTVSSTIYNGSINDGNRHKIILSQASGKIDVFVDGVKQITQKTTSATGFYNFTIGGNPGVYKINELAIFPKITDADAIALTTL